MTHRPCGACHALVPVESGCRHWRPGRSADGERASARRDRERADARARVEEFARVTGRAYR